MCNDGRTYQGADQGWCDVGANTRANTRVDDTNIQADDVPN